MSTDAPSDTINKANSSSLSFASSILKPMAFLLSQSAMP